LRGGICIFYARFRGGGGGEDGDARVREYVIHYLNMRALNGGSSRTLYMHIRHFCGYTAHVRAATIIHAAYTVTFSRLPLPPAPSALPASLPSPRSPCRRKNIRPASRLTAEICRSGMFYFKPGRLYADPMFIEQKAALRNNVRRINRRGNIFVPCLPSFT